MRGRFVASEIWIALRRNLGMAISVLLVTFVSLTFVGSAALLQLQVSKVKSYWYDKVQVSVFMCTPTSISPNCAGNGTGVTEEQKTAIEDQLYHGPAAQYVDRVFYESQQDAYNRFMSEFKDSASSISGNLTPDQMPQSFRVKLKDPDKYQLVTQAVQSMPGVEKVQDQSSLLNKLFSLINGLTGIALAFGAVMLVAAVLLIGTTVRLIAASRRRQVEIMRLVGASRMLIQLPFLLEVTGIAVTGALAACLTLWAGLHFGVQGFLKQRLPVFDYISDSAMFWVAPGLLGIAIVVGVVASLVTTTRHLRV